MPGSLQGADCWERRVPVKFRISAPVVDEYSVMARQRSMLSWLRLLFVGVLFLVVVLLTLWPVVEVAWYSGAGDDLQLRRLRYEQLESMREYVFPAFVAVWTFGFGATIGSFLNVVVWRMPRGETVVSRPSRCPFCATKIRARDNVPVLGWIMLDGRCRACRLPISPRYPIVEAILGTVFLALLYVEVFWKGWNLPETSHVSLPDALLYELNPTLVGCSMFHAFLFGLLLCWSLIAWDRQRMPKTLSVLCVFVGISVPLLVPDLLPVRWSEIQLADFADANRISVFLTQIFGLVIGSCWGLLIRYHLPRPTPEDASCRYGVILVMASVGLYFGWQATFVVALCGMVGCFKLWPLAHRAGRPDFAGLAEISLSLSALAMAVFWSYCHACYEAWPYVTLAIEGVGAVGLAVLFKKLSFRAEVDLSRFRRPENLVQSASPDLQLLASEGETVDNKG